MDKTVPKRFSRYHAIAFAIALVFIYLSVVETPVLPLIVAAILASGPNC